MNFMIQTPQDKNERSIHKEKPRLVLDYGIQVINQNDSFLKGDESQSQAQDSQSKSFFLQQHWQPEKEKQSNLAGESIHSKNNHSTDAELKDSGKDLRNKREIQHQLLESEYEQQSDSIQKSSTIVAHYKVGKDQQLEKITPEMRKNNSFGKTIQQLKRQKQWVPRQIPNDYFNDSELNDTNLGQDRVNINVLDGNKQLNPQLNPDSVRVQFSQALQRNFPSLGNAWPPQQSNSHQFQPQNNNFLYPNLPMNQNLSMHPNMGSHYQPQNFNPIHQSHAVNCIPNPPSSPHSETYWNHHRQQSHWSPHPNFQVMNEMKFLREQVRILRDSLKEERAQKFYEKFKSESKQFEKERRQMKEQNELQSNLLELKMMLQRQQKQHEIQLKKVQAIFISRIQQLQKQQKQLKQQNQLLRGKELNFSKMNSKEHHLHPFDNNIMTQRLSKRSKSNIVSEQGSKFSKTRTEDFLKQKLSASRKQSSAKNTQQKHKNSELKPRKNIKLDKFLA